MLTILLSVMLFVLLAGVLMTYLVLAAVSQTSWWLLRQAVRTSSKSKTEPSP